MESASREREDVEEDEKLLGQTSRSRDPVNPHPGRFRTSLVILAALCIALVSFSAGLLFATQMQWSVPQADTTASSEAVPRVPIATETKTFRLDSAFTTVPNRNETESAWDSLLPNGLGYIDNTELAPDLSVISVFHQLHCLYTIRRAYYADSSTYAGLEDFDFGHERTKHAGHCFEYLRQSLMCSADSSIEPAHVEKNGDREAFLGWDVPRTCRSYNQLKQWAEERRAFDAHGFLANDLHASGQE